MGGNAQVTEDAPILQAIGINKSFGPVHVLHDVDFAVYPGKVTALIGDNGAGKSTLVKCITGIYGKDSGEFRFEGQRVDLNGPKDAANLGIEVVYQDLALCENLDIVQNMFLGRERTKTSTARRALDGTGRTRHARQPGGAHGEERAPIRQFAVGWPAPDRGDRQGGAVELESGAARRADRGARRRPDLVRCSTSCAGSPTKGSVS